MPILVAGSIRTPGRLTLGIPANVLIASPIAWSHTNDADVEMAVAPDGRSASFGARAPGETGTTVRFAVAADGFDTSVAVGR
jgi:hypothetical protein